jgi:hypothetical protein
MTFMIQLPLPSLLPEQFVSIRSTRIIRSPVYDLCKALLMIVTFAEVTTHISELFTGEVMHVATVRG